MCVCVCLFVYVYVYVYYVYVYLVFLNMCLIKRINIAIQKKNSAQVCNKPAIASE